MQFCKLNHSTFWIQHKQTKILFDPGDYAINETQNLTNIDLLIITHNHPDHLHLPSVNNLLHNNPQLTILTNPEVAAVLQAEGIQAQTCYPGQTLVFREITIENLSLPHVEIWKELPHPENTGFIIDNYFYNPGDSFQTINRSDLVCVFMLTGPAVKISEALEFVLQQNPKLAIGVHDGMLNRPTASVALPKTILPKHSINFLYPELQKIYEI